MKRPPTVFPVCAIHPRYVGLRPPTSGHRRCTCQEIYREMQRRLSLKVGDLVYLKDVGFPFDVANEREESWEGASCVITRLNAGVTRDLVEVAPVFPCKIKSGTGWMTDCLFSYSNVFKEDRPWLKKKFYGIQSLRKKYPHLYDEIASILRRFC